jgi:hypothetical protein
MVHTLAQPGKDVRYVPRRVDVVVAHPRPPLPRAGCRRRPLEFTRADQNPFHAVVALVARVLEHGALRLRQHDDCGPRLCPRDRIVERDGPADGVRADPREALHQTSVLGPSAAEERQ